MQFFDSLIEQGPSAITPVVDACQVVVEREEFGLNDLLELAVLTILFLQPLLEALVDLLHSLLEQMVLRLGGKLGILSRDLLLNARRNWQASCSLWSEDRGPALVNEVGDVATHVEEIARALVAVAAKSLPHDILDGRSRHTVIIELPPDLLEPVVDVGVVVPVLGDSVVDHYRVQVVGSLLLLDVRLLEDLLDLLDLALQQLDLVLGGASEFAEHTLCDGDLLVGHAKLAPG